MTITQTVDIPADRRITLEVPREVPPGKTILAFTPVADQISDHEGECPICAANRDPVTGNPRYNAETIAAIEEGKAMLRGEIPATWHTSLDDLDEMLGL